MGSPVELAVLNLMLTLLRRSSFFFLSVFFFRLVSYTDTFYWTISFIRFLSHPCQPLYTLDLDQTERQ